MVRFRSPLGFVATCIIIAIAVFLVTSVFHVQDQLHDIMLSKEGHDMMKEEEAMGMSMGSMDVIDMMGSSKSGMMMEGGHASMPMMDEDKGMKK